MNRNTLYLVALWSFAGGMVLLLTVPAMIVLGPGHPWPYIVVATLVVLSVGGPKLGAWVGDRRIRRLLRSETPEDLVEFYERTIRPSLIPDGDAMLANGIALGYALYAEFDAARRTLRGIDWERRVPLVRATGISVEALLCYLETGRYEMGLELARAGREMARVSKAFPGSRTSAAAFDSYVEIGEILCGDTSDEKVAGLERKQVVLPTVGKLLIAWGLAAAYDERGEHAKAESARKFIRDVAPHCRGISSPPSKHSA